MSRSPFNFRDGDEGFPYINGESPTGFDQSVSVGSPMIRSRLMAARLAQRGPNEKDSKSSKSTNKSKSILYPKHVHKKESLLKALNSQMRYFENNQLDEKPVQRRTPPQSISTKRVKSRKSINYFKHPIYQPNMKKIKTNLYNTSQSQQSPKLDKRPYMQSKPSSVKSISSHTSFPRSSSQLGIRKSHKRNQSRQGNAYEQQIRDSTPSLLPLDVGSSRSKSVMGNRSSHINSPYRPNSQAYDAQLPVSPENLYSDMFMPKNPMQQQQQQRSSINSKYSPSSPHYLMQPAVQKRMPRKRKKKPTDSVKSYRSSGSQRNISQKKYIKSAYDLVQAPQLSKQPRQVTTSKFKAPEKFYAFEKMNKQTRQEPIKRPPGISHNPMLKNHYKPSPPRGRPRSKFDFYEDLKGDAHYLDEEYNPFHARTRPPSYQPFFQEDFLLILEYVGFYTMEATAMMMTCSEWRDWVLEASIKKRMHMMQRLIECTGIEFIHVPAGVYMVGSTPSSSKYYTIPSQFVKVEEFFISKRLIHLSDWELISEFLESEHGVDTSDMITKEDVETVFVNTINVRNQHLYYKKDYVERDPALEISLRKSASISMALGATLPTWKQWEIVARGVNATHYPWGNKRMAKKKIGIEKIHYVYETDDLSSLEFKRKRVKGHVTRVKSLEDYASRPSEFKMEDLVHFGREINLVQNDVEPRCLSRVAGSRKSTNLCEPKTHLFRSLTYLGPQTTFVTNEEDTTQDPLDVINFEKMASSEHRSYNAPSLSSCYPPNSKYVSKERAAFRLVFSKSYFQVNPKISAGYFKCNRCEKMSVHQYMCLSCLTGNGLVQKGLLDLIGRFWNDIEQIIPYDADMEKSEPDWTRHRFFKLYYDGFMITSSNTKNEPESIEDLMIVESISFFGPEYEVEKAFILENGYQRTIIPNVYFGMKREEMVELFGKGYAIDLQTFEYSGDFLIDYEDIMEEVLRDDDLESFEPANQTATSPEYISKPLDIANNPLVFIFHFSSLVNALDKIIVRRTSIIESDDLPSPHTLNLDPL